MIKFEHSGNSFPFTADADIAANSIHVLGDLVGYVRDGVTNGEDGELHLTGVVKVATSQPVADEGFAVGDSVCWDADNGFPIAYDETKPAFGHITELFESAISVRLCQSVGGVVVPDP